MNSENSVFTRRHEDAMAQDKRALLEEMNLPPVVIDFLRTHSKNIKIAIAVIVVCIIAWEGYGEYSDNKREKASTMLYSAIKAESASDKTEMLMKLEDEFSGSKSALWAKLELGHLAFKDNDFQGAVDKYLEVLGKLDPVDSLFPLVQYSVAQAYDNLGDDAKAGEAYDKLLGYPGFAAEGYLGLGRQAEKNGNSAKAVEMYDSYANLPDVATGPTLDMIKNKIANLKNL